MIFRALALLALALAPKETRTADAAQAPVFRVDRSSVWQQFRHGGGLNDVVENPRLPKRPTWRYDGAGDGTSTSPVVSGSLVLIAGNDGVLYALSGSTGEQIWRWRGDNQIMSAPVYRDGIVVVGTGNADSVVWDPPRIDRVGSGPSDLDGIDLKTGKSLWSTPLAGTGMPMPALVGSRALHVDGRGVLLAVDVRTGVPVWRRTFLSDAAMTNILLNGGLGYFGGGFPAAIYAFNPSDGSRIWTHRFPLHDRSFDDCPLATNGNLVFGMYSELIGGGPRDFIVAGSTARQHVYALDAKSGRRRWDATLAVSGIVPQRNESAIPMYAGGAVYDGSAMAPYVTALDARSGHVKWSLRVSGAVKGGFVLRGGVLYFGDSSGRLWAVDAATGHALGSVHTDLNFNVGSPIMLNDSVVLGSMEGAIIAIPADAIRASRAVPGITTSPFGSRWYAAVGIFIIILVLAGFLVVRESANATGGKASGRSSRR